MELPSAIKLLVLAQALALASAGEETIDGVTHGTIAHSLSGPQPELFTTGDDDLNVTVNGCIKRNNLVCCFNQPMARDLSGPRICSDFGPTQCCYLIPGRHEHPRVPRDLVPLLPTLTVHGQCEQRRRGRRVLHCCRGTVPVDPEPSGGAARICSSVGAMRCCYNPFAGHRLAIAVSSTKDYFVGAFIVKAVNDEDTHGDDEEELTEIENV